MAQWDKMIHKIAACHNTEVDFYETFGEILKDIPSPKVFYMEKMDPNEKKPGIIMMNDLSESSETLGIYNGLQIFHVRYFKHK